jgi:hypothetical protein
MHSTKKTERGQALVLIVFAIVGLIGITGLAIDGGNAYSDRRHAQNAADTAVMAASLSKVRTGWPAGRDAGYQIAAQNGYDNNGTTNTVHVYRCDEADSSCALPNPLPPGDVITNYVQVTIESTVHTYFAPLLGVRTMSNYVQAVAKAVEPTLTRWYDGNALVALMPGCKPNGWPDDPFTVTGSNTSLVLGASGVFVNSACAGAFSAQGGASLTAPTICMVPGATANVSNQSTVSPTPTNCGTPMDPQAYKLPPLGPDSCTTNGHVGGNASTGYIATPGNYSATFPPVSPAGDIKLTRGIYCLNNSNAAINFNSNWTITTDVNDNGNIADSTEGVVLYVPHGSVTFGGGAMMELSAMEDAQADALGIKGYLLYLPPTNSSAVNIAGGGGSKIQGTILAPAAPVSIGGGSDSASFSLQSQIIGYSLKLAGGSYLQITYDQSLNGMTWTSPLLQPYNSK